MSKPGTYKRISNMLIICILQFFVCQIGCKEQDPTLKSSETYLQTIGQSGEHSTGIIKTGDGYVVVGNSDSVSRRVRKIKANGNLEWETNVLTSSNTYINNGIVLNNGDLLFNSHLYGNDVTRLNSHGDLVFNNKIGEHSYTITSPLVLDAENNAYFGYINNASSDDRYARIVKFDPNLGNEIITYRYYSKLIGMDFAPGTFQIYKATKDHFWVVGDQAVFYPVGVGPFPLQIKTFVIKLESKDNSFVKKYIFTENDSTFAEELSAISILGNEDLVTATSENNIYARGGIYIDGSLNTKYFDVRRIDLELNEKWNTRISFPGDFIQPRSICETPSGDIIVVGNFRELGSAYTSSFAVRISPNGVFLNLKIFKEKRDFMLIDVIADGEDYLVFTGHSSGFGKGKESSKSVILKTDQNFDY